MLIAVHDAAQHLESRDCRIVRLPDCRQGAIWRGLAYPLDPAGDRIDIDGEAFPPGVCGPAEAPARFAVIDGAEEAYLLVGGPAAACERAAQAMSMMSTACTRNLPREGRSALPRRILIPP